MGSVKIQSNLVIFFFLFLIFHNSMGFAQKADTLQNFDSGTISLVSYSAEDEDPDAWELSSAVTWNNSPYALKLFGNIRSFKILTPVPSIPQQSGKFQPSLNQWVKYRVSGYQMEQIY